VTFTPLALGSRNAYLSIASSAPNSPQTIALSGSGAAGSSGPVALSPTSLNFYEQGQVQTVTLTNYGVTPLAIAAINISSANWTQVNNCGSSLDAQSVCIIAITAGQTYGQFTGTLTVIDSDTTDTQTVALTSDIRVLKAPAPFPKGTATGFASNIGTYSGGVYTNTVQGFDFYSYSGTFSGANPGNFSLLPPSCTAKSPLTVCSFNALVTPTGSGLLSAYLSTNAGETFYFKEFGAGGTKSFVFTPAALGFGSKAVGSSTTLQLEVDNTWWSDFTFDPATLTAGAANNGDFAVNSTACATLRASAAPLNGTLGYCRLQITFTPTTTGLRWSVLTLTDSTGYRQTALITGQGAPPPPTVTPSVQFGNVPIGSTSLAQTVDVTVPNHNAATAQITASGDVFQISGGNSCAQGASTCQFAVVFSPTVAGQVQGTLTVTDTVTGNAAISTLTGTGGVPVVSLSSTSLTYAPRTVGISSIPQNVTLTNNGDIPLVITGLTFTGTNPGDFSQTNTCGTVTPAATCTISVSFTPSAVGARSASLTITSNASTSPDVIQLTGTGN
jgi:hypothetical protein